MFADEVEGRTGPAALIARAATFWAILGGFLLLAVVAVNAASVLGGLFGTSFSGDFELTEMGVAIAVFAFLPYCQLTDANVTADIFTARASPRVVAGLRALASLVAFGFGCLLLWRMYPGMVDQRDYNASTAILQIPIWWAYLPILVSLLLLVATAALTFFEDLHEARG